MVGGWTRGTKLTKGGQVGGAAEQTTEGRREGTGARICGEGRREKGYAHREPKAEERVAGASRPWRDSGSTPDHR